jgi:hypothetical protein
MWHNVNRDKSQGSPTNPSLTIDKLSSQMSLPHPMLLLRKRGCFVTSLPLYLQEAQQKHDGQTHLIVTGWWRPHLGRQAPQVLRWSRSLTTTSGSRSCNRNKCKESSTVQFNSTIDSKQRSSVECEEQYNMLSFKSGSGDTSAVLLQGNLQWLSSWNGWQAGTDRFIGCKGWHSQPPAQ